MDVNGKVVLITGASEGIGRTTARLLAAEGAQVAAAARSVDRLEELTSGLDGALAVQVDMTDPVSISAMVDTVIAHYGRIDVLINNAGRALRAAVTDIAVDDFDAIMHLNLYGPLLAMQAVVPHMRAQGGGAIVNISSNVSKMAIPTIGAYASTKYALNGLTLTARNELADDGIVVSLMLPGATDTKFGANAMQGGSTQSGRPGGSQVQPDSPDQVAEKILETIRSGEAEVAMPMQR